MREKRCLVLFTKPARPGRVKTRLVGELTAEQAAALHAAFLGDVVERLREGAFQLRVAWALEAAEPVPAEPGPGVRQRGAGLGERLFAALRDAAERYPVVAAVGSDHPELEPELVERAFERLEAGTGVVLGPAADGGYYLIGARRTALAPELFERVPWSTERVLAATLERCRRLGIEPALLPERPDVDTPADLERLELRLAAAGAGCPRTRALLASWRQRAAPSAGAPAGTPAGTR